MTPYHKLVSDYARLLKHRLVGIHGHDKLSPKLGESEAPRHLSTT